MFNLKDFFNFGFNVTNQNYNIIFLAKITNYILFFVLTFFSILNIFIKQNYVLALVEIIFALYALKLIQLLNKNIKIEETLILTTINLFVISILYYVFIDKVIFAAVWLFFFPLIVFLLNGLRIGRIFTILYLIIIIGYSYYGIGVFTDIRGFMHISIALMFFSYFVCEYEKSRKKSYLKMLDAMKKLEDISYLDELTKLYNRHFLNEKILKNERLTNKSLLFCITDIDNFKTYNDYYGHQKGDETLKQIAAIKDMTIGSGDNHFVIRLGGEEFGGFIFNSDNPKKYIEVFFKALASASLEHKKNFPFDTCTVSMGAVYSENSNGLNFSKLYQLADEALYEAKKGGKNRVVYKNI